MNLVVERSREAMQLLKRVMKRSVALSVILILDAAVALAQAEPSSTRFSNSLLDDAVQMTKAGLSDATIVAYVRARRARLDSILSADELIQMRREGVSETVIQYFTSVAAVDVGQSGEGRDEEVTYDSREGTAYPIEPAYDGYAYPYGYGYYPPYDGGYFSSSTFLIRRPFFHRRFFHRPFFHRNFFFRHRFVRRPFFHRNFFFRHRFVHRPFFPGRGFHDGFAAPRRSVPVGSRIAFPPIQGRAGPRFVSPRSQVPRGRRFSSAR